MLLEAVKNFIIHFADKLHAPKQEFNDIFVKIFGTVYRQFYNFILQRQPNPKLLPSPFYSDQMIKIKNPENNNHNNKICFFPIESNVFLLKIFVTNLIIKVPLKLSKLLSMCKK